MLSIFLHAACKIKNENDMSETADQLKARFTTGKTVTSESMNALVDAISASSTTKETLKSYFETGDKPTQAQFYELIDAIFEQPGKLLGIQCLFMNGHQYGTASYLLEAISAALYVSVVNAGNLKTVATYTGFELSFPNIHYINCIGIPTGQDNYVSLHFHPEGYKSHKNALSQLRIKHGIWKATSTGLSQKTVFTNTYMITFVDATYEARFDGISSSYDLTNACYGYIDY